MPSCWPTAGITKPSAMPLCQRISPTSDLGVSMARRSKRRSAQELRLWRAFPSSKTFWSRATRSLSGLSASPSSRWKSLGASAGHQTLVNYAPKSSRSTSMESLWITPTPTSVTRLRTTSVVLPRMLRQPHHQAHPPARDRPFLQGSHQGSHPEFHQGAHPVAVQVRPPAHRLLHPPTRSCPPGAFTGAVSMSRLPSATRMNSFSASSRMPRPLKLA